MVPLCPPSFTLPCTYNVLYGVLVVKYIVLSLLCDVLCHMRCPRCHPVRLVCILSSLEWSLPSLLISCIVSPATECKLLSIFVFGTFIFCSVKVAPFCSILVFLHSTLSELVEHFIFYSVCIFCLCLDPQVLMNIRRKPQFAICHNSICQKLF